MWVPRPVPGFPPVFTAADAILPGRFPQLLYFDKVSFSVSLGVTSFQPVALVSGFIANVSPSVRPRNGLTAGTRPALGPPERQNEDSISGFPPP